MTPNVLVALGEDAQKPDGAELLDAVARPIYVRTSEEYLSAREHAEVMFVCDLNTPFVREHGPGRLAWIHTNSIGVNAVATPEVAAAGTQVSNTRGVFERPMAEFVLSSILAQSQLLRQAHQFQAEKRWQQRTVGLIRDRHVVVIGAGGVGVAIARLLRRVDMRVSIVGRTRRQDTRSVDGAPLGLVHGMDELGALLAEADDVVLAAPLTNETRGLIGRPELRLMKPTSHFVNVGRGALVDEAALREALESEWINHATLDVFDVEPLPNEHPFWTMPNVTVSPHQSAVYAAWQEDVTRLFIQNLKRWLRGEPLENPVSVSEFLAVSS
ncbi:MAG: D-2-hydroxyacid dehydrogenase [Canibacter sp.]